LRDFEKEFGRDKRKKNVTNLSLVRINNSHEFSRGKMYLNKLAYAGIDGVRRSVRQLGKVR
jgi:hypothetical protein